MMEIKPENEIFPEDETNLYDYWKVLVKRKKILLGIFLIPLVIVTVVSLSLPRYYRGESEISNPILPPQDLVRLINHIDESKKNEIFINKPSAIKSVSVSISKESNNIINIIIDAKTLEDIHRAFNDMYCYIAKLPEIEEEVKRLNEIAELKLNNLIETRKANRIFLNQITEMIKKRQLLFININPADLIKKDADLSLEIINIQKLTKNMTKKRQLSFVNNNPSIVSEWKLINKDGQLTLEGIKLQSINAIAGTIGPLSITKQPSNSWIKQIIVITGLLSLILGIFAVFILENGDRIKAREK